MKQVFATMCALRRWAIMLNLLGKIYKYIRNYHFTHSNIKILIHSINDCMFFIDIEKCELIYIEISANFLQHAHYR
jgi:hypothetical protein